MTSAEIKEMTQDARSEAGWLKEIAYQLAVMNEARPEFKPEVKQPIQVGRKIR